MGYGDQLMATGMARGAAARGKRIAFGDGKRIIWDHLSPHIFRHNPNIARPGDEGLDCLEWIPFYRGNRIYARNDAHYHRWSWNYDFRAQPGQMFFEIEELAYGKQFGNGFVLIEPISSALKLVGPNKQWPVKRFDQLADELIIAGHQVAQFVYSDGHVIPGAKQIKAPSFRHALAVLQHAALYVGPEGGLHHGAAAVGIPAVVLFGGFIPPQVTGYPTHTNISVGKACGRYTACSHCTEAMASISLSTVSDAVFKRLHEA